MNANRLWYVGNEGVDEQEGKKRRDIVSLDDGAGLAIRVWEQKLHEAQRKHALEVYRVSIYVYWMDGWNDSLIDR